MKIDTSNIDKKQSISDYERQYGKGDNAKMYFAFKMIQIIVVAIFAAIILVFGINFIFMKFFDGAFFALYVLQIIIPIFGMTLTFMFGYLFGKPSDSKK